MCLVRVVVVCRLIQGHGISNPSRCAAFFPTAFWFTNTGELTKAPSGTSLALLFNLQAPPGVGGYLVSGVEEAASKILYLLQNPDVARRLADEGHQRVKEHFLTTRLLADELRLLQSLTV